MIGSRRVDWTAIHICPKDVRQLTTACSGRAKGRASYPQSFVRAADDGRWAANLSGQITVND